MVPPRNNRQTGSRQRHRQVLRHSRSRRGRVMTLRGGPRRDWRNSQSPLSKAIGYGPAGPIPQRHASLGWLSSGPGDLVPPSAGEQQYSTFVLSGAYRRAVSGADRGQRNRHAAEAHRDPPAPAHELATSALCHQGRSQPPARTRRCDHHKRNSGPPPLAPRRNTGAREPGIRPYIPPTDPAQSFAKRNAKAS